ncbi:C45 family autoproteolytic acyltransferase/hydolase [Candidatus Parabeggiatoa sp. HSG14]|uniref:C45 family autoproteolytic acyltransferase/hydolase n=1 Tax=Candidatus Parabeggiatoa sp. HSG14 TaxID=3055593 RepID=UPI0025A74892|nr:C45 family autoproteolytic acyltransferase/hydrolase [Thiotrichales bacterium HSG14]
MTKIIKIITFSFLFFSDFVGAETNAIAIFHIDAKNKTGIEIGNTLGNAIKEKFPDIEKKYDSYLASFVDQAQFNEWVQTRVNFIKPNIDSAYRDEVNAIASTWAIYAQDKLGDGYLSLNEWWVIQLIPDIGRRTNCSGFGVFGNFSALNAPIVGRNMDWRTTEALRSIQAITVYEYKQRTMVNIGFAGYIGVISGFNSDGLFVAHLDSPLGKYYPDPPIGDHAIVFDLKRVLEKTTVISTAARYLFKQQYGFSHNILMADTKDVQVLEQPQGMTAKLRNYASSLKMEMSWGKINQIAVVNCFVLESSPFNCVDSVDRYRWHRFKKLAQFNSNNKAYVEDVTKIMFDTVQEIFNPHTVQSMVFTPKDKKLYLYTVPISGIHESPPIMNEIHNLLSVSSTQEKISSKEMILWFIVISLLLVTLWIYFGEKTFK